MHPETSERKVMTMRLLGKIRIVTVASAAVIVALTFLAGPGTAGAVDTADSFDAKPGCSTPEPSTYQPMLKRGMYGLNVEYVQSMVGAHPDGCFGPATEHKVREFQSEYGLYIDGIVGSCTWRTIDSGSAPSGCRTGGGTSQSTTPAPAADTQCSVENIYGQRAQDVRYVVCIDTASQGGSVRIVNDGVVGEKVVSVYAVTTSRSITFNGDSITRTGHFELHNAARYSYTKRLEYFMPFPQVGRGYDSSGCVRLQRATAETLWELLEVSGLIDQGRVQAHIY